MLKKNVENSLVCIKIDRWNEWQLHIATWMNIKNIIFNKKSSHQIIVWCHVYKSQKLENLMYIFRTTYICSKRLRGREWQPQNF